MSVKNMSLTDMSRVSDIIPPDIKIAIADVIIEFSKMDSAAEILIWSLCGLPFDLGSLLTTMDARPKFELPKKLVEKHHIKLSTPELPSIFWQTATDLRNLRNAVAHGQWILVDGAIPAVASYRSKDQQGKRIMAEAFTLERLDAISRQCTRMRDFILRLEHEFQTRPKEPPLRHRKSSHPRDQDQ